MTLLWVIFYNLGMDEERDENGKAETSLIYRRAD